MTGCRTRDMTGGEKPRRRSIRTKEHRRHSMEKPGHEKPILGPQIMIPPSTHCSILQTP